MQRITNFKKAIINYVLPIAMPLIAVLAIGPGCGGGGGSATPPKIIPNYCDKEPRKCIYIKLSYKECNTPAGSYQKNYEWNLINDNTKPVEVEIYKERYIDGVDKDWIQVAGPITKQLNANSIEALECESQTILSKLAKIRYRIGKICVENSCDFYQKSNEDIDSKDKNKTNTCSDPAINCDNCITMDYGNLEPIQKEAIRDLYKAILNSNKTKKHIFRYDIVNAFMDIAKTDSVCMERYAKLDSNNFESYGISNCYFSFSLPDTVHFYNYFSYSYMNIVLPNIIKGKIKIFQKNKSAKAIEFDVKNGNSIMFNIPIANQNSREDVLKYVMAYNYNELVFLGRDFVCIRVVKISTD